MEYLKQAKNKVYATRLNYFSKSQTVEFYGRFDEDLLISDRMPNIDVNMNIRLIRASSVCVRLAHVVYLTITYQLVKLLVLP